MFSGNFSNSKKIFSKLILRKNILRCSQKQLPTSKILKIRKIIQEIRNLSNYKFLKMNSTAVVLQELTDTVNLEWLLFSIPENDWFYTFQISCPEGYKIRNLYLL